jgi:hypothetical protein
MKEAHAWYGRGRGKGMAWGPGRGEGIRWGWKQKEGMGVVMRVHIGGTVVKE